MLLNYLTRHSRYSLARTEALYRTPRPLLSLSVSQLPIVKQPLSTPAHRRSFHFTLQSQLKKSQRSVQEVQNKHQHANMSTQHTHSAACCSIPPIVSDGYEPEGKYEQIGGMKTCMSMNSYFLRAENLIDTPIQMLLAPLMHQPLSLSSLTFSASSHKRYRGLTSWLRVISIISTRFSCLISSMASQQIFPGEFFAWFINSVWELQVAQ